MGGRRPRGRGLSGRAAAGNRGTREGRGVCVCDLGSGRSKVARVPPTPGIPSAAARRALLSSLVTRSASHRLKRDRNCVRTARGMYRLSFSLSVALWLHKSVCCSEINARVNVTTATRSYRVPGSSGFPRTGHLNCGSHLMSLITLTI